VTTEQRRILVVSNRLPVKLSRAGTAWRAERSTGGLATAMNPILKSSEGLWIGWPGTSAGLDDPKRRPILDRWAAEDRLIAVDLPPDIAQHFYEGYANQTLWPLFHHFPSRVVFDPKGWAAYESANKRFCEVVVRHYRPGDLVWVHDYQLMLLPNLLRQALPDAALGFFLHIPFPSSEVFRILPEREKLLEGLLGANLLAFHTHSHLRHFRSSLLRVLGRESRINELDAGERIVRLEAIPIGIAPEEFTNLLGTPEVAGHMAELRQRYEGQRILLAVDRLDYTKGIPERLRTYRRLLTRAPQLRGKIVLLQVAVPSRERIVSYEALQRQVNELVGEINGHFGSADWTPVVYIRRGISPSHLAALYAVSDVGWVTPLRDGMNLVSKEYVACKLDDSGVLVLSEFAGAAEEMGEAFLVNPYDEESTAATLERVLTLDAQERRRRIEALRRRVGRNNVFAWAERFVSILRDAASAPATVSSDRPVPLDVESFLDAYRNARRRMMFLDYDGTLVPYAKRPERATPPRQLDSLLRRIVEEERSCVMLISGRQRADLERWFGTVPGLWLAAEHGALLRLPEAVDWQPLRPDFSRDVIDQVLPVLQHFVDRTPGSFVEQKEYSIVWHYRMSEPQFADWLANELVAMLEELLAETELRAFRGRKIIEVKPLWVHKGAVVERLSEYCGPADFIFGIGDDRTDEDLFRVLDADAWTVRVGDGRSRARFRLPDSTHVLDLLERMAGVEAPSSRS
jgi:trehalose 6-phosphate synthase/phosphatase